MKRILSMCWVVAALACSSVKDKQECSVSTDCPVGQYCAHAGGEARCWADTVPPVVGTVTASCTPSPCLRDGVLHVEADVTDDAEVLEAAVALDLASGTPVALAPSGGKWVADVQLRGLPFPAYSRDDVVATVTARDGARNGSNEGRATGIGITRLRWERAIAAGAVVTPTPPAVKPDGTVVIGGSDGRLYLIHADGSDAQANPLAVASGPITAAPGIGSETIWLGSEDGTLYGAAPDGSATKAGVGVSTTGAIKGSIAISGGAAKEWAFALFSTGFAGVASTVAGESDVTGPAATFAAGPVVVDSSVFGATGVSSATVRAYALNTTAVVLSESWSAPVGRNVSAPLAVDGGGAIWTGTFDGKLNKTVPGDTGGTVIPITTVPGAIVDSPVILANGDVVVGDDTGVLHRYTSSGAQVWTSEPNLGAAVNAPLVLAGGDAAFIVPTVAGTLFARAADGLQVWSATLDNGNTLRPPNIYTPPGQTAPVMSTAYLTSSSGKLFAVIVDGQLDAAAPWPKAFHDPRNTNRAGPQP